MPRILLTSKWIVVFSAICFFCIPNVSYADCYRIFGYWTEKVATSTVYGSQFISINEDTGAFISSPTAVFNTGTSYLSLDLSIYRFDGASWWYTGVNVTKFVVSQNLHSGSPSPEITCDTGYIFIQATGYDVCSDETDNDVYTQIEFLQKCGGEVLSYDHDACTGICGACGVLYQELTSRCGAYGIAHFDGISCIGWCNSCESEYDKCIEASGGLVANVDTFTCNEYTDSEGNVELQTTCISDNETEPCKSNIETCAQLCGPGNVDVNECYVDGDVEVINCLCINPPGGDFCLELQNDCISDCGGDQNVAVNECNYDVGTGDAFFECQCFSDSSGDITPGLLDPNDLAGSDSQNLQNIVNNQGVQSQQLDHISNQISDSNSLLSSLNDKFGKPITADIGAGQLPDVNEYDSEIVQPDETDFAGTVSQFMTNGLPIISYIKGTYIDLADSKSSMCVDLWGSQVCFDLAPMESILNTMGLVLVGIAVIVAFMIIL